MQAIPRIVDLLDSEDELVREKVVEVIWNLAGNDENRSAVLYAGGVQKLLDLLQVYSGRGAEQTERREMGASGRSVANVEAGRSGDHARSLWSRIVRWIWSSVQRSPMQHGSARRSTLSTHWCIK